LVTLSTEDAMVLLRERRRFLIAYGRYVAAELCRLHGVTHSREVRREMATKGLLDDPDLHDYWLGVVFHDGPFEWTGEFHAYTDARRNIHERTVKVWRLRKGSEAACLLEPVPDVVETARRTGVLGNDCIVVWSAQDGIYSIYE
jgi:hypothetical protein